MYTMIPRSVYNQLTQKPPLCPVSQFGVVVSNQKFKIDGVAHLNLLLKGTAVRPSFYNRTKIITV